MKVAIVIDIFHDKGNGTSMSARHLVENLVERGVEVKVLCDNAEQKTETMQGVEFVTFPIQQVPIYQKVIEQQHAWLASPNDARRHSKAWIWCIFICRSRLARIARA